MKTLLSLILLLFALTAFSQVPEPAMLWLKGYGGDGGDQVLKEVTKTADGGFIIGIEAGSDAHTGNIDSFCALTGDRTIFLKYNADASVLEWSKCFWTNGDTSIGYIFPTTNGEFVLGGNYSTTGSGFYLCRQDALGNIIWSHGYSRGDGLFLEGMIAADNGNYILIGESYYTDTNASIHHGSSMDADILVMKVDSEGNKIWSEVIGGTGDETVYSIIAAPNDGCYIVGGTSSNDYDCTGNHGGYDVYLARLDSNGNILWHNDLGGGGDDIGHYGCADGKNGALIVANSNSSDGDVMHHITAGMQNIWALEVDSSNNMLWSNCYGGGGGELSNAICKATDGSVWIAGLAGVVGEEVDTVYGKGEAWFVHADSIGNFINAKVLGSNQQDEGRMVYPLSNGNIIAGGYYGINNGSFTNIEYYGSFDAFLTIFAPSNQTWVKQISTINNEVKIYPNPAQEEVNIVVSRQNSYGIKITNIIGNVVYQANFNSKLQIQIKDWRKGIYYVQVIRVGGYRSMQKLVVE